MSLKYFFDLMSQPSRSVYIFLKVNNIPFEPCAVALRKGENLTEEFKVHKNRLQKIPIIHDNDFKLGESIAIVRYLAKKYNLDNNWYPSNLTKRARIDEYLEWQHSNTRLNCSNFFQHKWLLPLVKGQITDEKDLNKFRTKMENTLIDIENLFLSETPFIGGEKISVADIFAATEIEQPKLAGYDAVNERPKLGAWLKRVRDEANPVYSEAHAILNKIHQNQQKPATN